MRTQPNEPINAIVEDNNYEGQLIREARYSGLTKREYFAGLAMQARVSGGYTGQAGMSFKNIAEYSVQMADALIEELNLESEATHA